MEYDRSDYEQLYGDHWLVKSSRKTRLVIVLVLLAWVVGAALLSACEGEVQTEIAEQEAHQQYLDTWVRFHSTTTPIRASDLGKVATACHQLQDRKWECYAK